MIELTRLIQGISLPLICLSTLPLALFAGLTTVLAWSLLLIRIALIYIEVALSLIPDYLMHFIRSPPSPTVYYATSPFGDYITPAGQALLPIDPPARLIRHPRPHSDHYRPVPAVLRDGDACMGSVASAGMDHDLEGLGSRSLADADDKAWESPAHEVLRRELLGPGDPRRERRGRRRSGSVL
ncbi:hypothetical protein VTI74DRAFT_4897 [Chaetomium olivicolor]